MQCEVGNGGGMDGEGRGSGNKWIRESVCFGHSDCEIFLDHGLVVAALGIKACTSEKKEREHRTEL